MERILSREAQTYTGDGSPGQGFSFSDTEFARVRGLIYRKAGIALAPHKKDMVYSRLARRLRALGLSSFTEYLKLVEAAGEPELEAFINALTTNLTSFFREPHHFKLLGERLARQPAGRAVTIWSCGCSTGQEPYSIAMAARQALGEETPLRILATDIDTTVLARARQGVYPLDQLQKVPAGLLRRFFLKGAGRQEGLGRVKDELKRLVSFERVNLQSESWPIPERFDYIFCRNVMIYFDRETQHGILQRLASRLKPEGLLFVGHSESLHGSQTLFKSCGNTAYTLRK
ncbi:CheR family methyltransferase [Geomonas sp.]|uniref:CheR family methyltransferase n=1 Tax=Geomonas sp. TaxID=2651584 RepID=UPI002B4A6C90|nr:CheR family methyltransferase [Geomonas sp.]HJV35003.1 CheR family methyltransferase [Geomonas sp.]